MRHFLSTMVLCCAMISASAAVSVSIGIDVPAYPALSPVPGYPVYYAPGLDTNYFFYDGSYWVYTDDVWYTSSWYNGPWAVVAPEYVPSYILRVPVRYYRRPPPYFRGWRANAPPHWAQHWGHSWAQHRVGWNTWNHHAVPAAAPLPEYQRRYSGTHYPHPEEQETLHHQNYHYQPREHIARPSERGSEMDRR